MVMNKIHANFGTCRLALACRHCRGRRRRCNCLLRGRRHRGSRADTSCHHRGDSCGNSVSCSHRSHCAPWGDSARGDVDDSLLAQSGVERGGGVAPRRAQTRWGNPLRVSIPMYRSPCRISVSAEAASRTPVSGARGVQKLGQPRRIGPFAGRIGFPHAAPWTHRGRGQLWSAGAS